MPRSMLTEAPKLVESIGFEPGHTKCDAYRRI
jgi:hypothetical protein